MSKVLNARPGLAIFPERGGVEKIFSGCARVVYKKKFILTLKMIFEVFGGPKSFLEGVLSKVCHVKVAITTIFLATKEAVREEMKLDESTLF